MSESADAVPDVSGLVIDDYLHALADVTQQFKLSIQKFSLSQIAKQPGLSRRSTLFSREP
jgi:hypothetical protein